MGEHMGSPLHLGEKEDLSSRIFLGPPDGPNIIFFPAEYDGEAEITELAEKLSQFGMTLIVPEYRENLKKAVLHDPDHLFEYTNTFFRFINNYLSKNGRTGPLILMGRSIGSALSLDVASKNQESILCLIMESAFDKATYFSVRPEDIFKNREKMAAFKKTVLFLHSSRDELVSLSEIEWLVAESRSKATQFQIVPSPSRKNLAASTGEFYFKTIRDFIQLRMGIRPKRKKYRT